MDSWVFILILIVGAFIFSFAGVIVLLSRTKRQEESIRKLQRQIDTIVRIFNEKISKSSADLTAAAPEPPIVPVADTAATEAADAAVTVASDTMDVAAANVSDTAAAKSTKPNRLHSTLLSFIKSGNLWAAGGVILLTAGFGTLIAYLGRRGFFTVEMGIIAAAAAGLVMILSGWRFRRKKPIFFLILQGGGIGLLFLSIFAANKLTGYLGVPLSLVLITVLIPPTAVLALFQNSQGLAALGFLGGFAAPILLSTGGGNHLFLFIYYVILNAGILVIAFFRIWKGLNLLGFFFTFGVSIYWAMQRYVPEFFITSEPFFIIFIIIFTVLGLRGLKNPAPFIDIILIVGTAAAAIALQWKVFSFIEHGHSLISIAFSGFYLLLTMVILKKFPAWRICAEGYLAMGILLANLVIPLELAPNIAGAIWAAEGAVLFFLGLRVFSKELRDKRIIAAGIIVHVAAALAFIRDIHNKWYLEDLAKWRSPALIGSLIIAVSALAMAVLAEKLMGQQGKKHNILAWTISVWGFAWWFGGWYFELNRIYPEPADAFLLLASASAFISFLAFKLLRMDFFATGMIPAPLLAAFIVLKIFGKNMDRYFSRDMELVFTHNFFDPSRIKGWLSFLLFHVLTFFRFRTEKNSKPSLFYNTRLFIFLLTALAILSASGRYYTMNYGLSPSWTSLAGLLPIFAALVLLPVKFSRKGQGTGEEADSANYAQPFLTHTVLPIILSLILGLWFIYALFMTGDPSPLPFYIPVLNPLDLLQGLCIASMVFWIANREPANKREVKKAKLIILTDVMVFLWIVSILARSVHYYAGIRWHRVTESDAFQLSLFIFCALYGILHIVLGHRMKKRVPWIAGAILVTLDIAKLIILDMRDIGAIPRILSFFAAGIVLLFIGWAAPLPPAAASKNEDNSNTSGDTVQ